MERKVKIEIKLEEAESNKTVTANLEQKLKRIANQFTNDPAIAAAKNTQKQYQAIGRETVAGLSQGIKSGSNLVTREIDNVLKQTISQAKKTLEIKSPSRIFYTIGQNITQGLQGGIKSISLGTLMGNIFAELINSAVNSVQRLGGFLYDAGKASMQAAADFEATRNALGYVAGNSIAAGRELAEVDQIARRTTGLALISAETGYTRLRNLNFTIQESKGLLKGIAEQKIISRADEGAVDRVLVNLTQLKNGSYQAKRDLQQIILSMPSFTNVFEKTFGTADTTKIAKEFNRNPDDAISKLAAEMEKSKGISGGLSDAWSKLGDAWETVKRALGTPIINPLTEDIKDLTKWIYENKQSWENLGVVIKGIYQDISSLVKNRSKEKGFFGELGDSINSFNPAYLLAKKYRQELLERENKNVFVGEDIYQLEAMKKDYDEAKALRKKQKKDDSEDQLAFLKSNQSVELNAIKQNFAVKSALLASQLRLTIQDEINYIKQANGLKQNELGVEFRAKKSNLQKQLKLEEGNIKEETKLRAEITQNTIKYNSDVLINEIETQTRITQIERQQLEQRRQSQIEYKQSLIREIQQTAGSAEFDFTRQISFGINVEQNFEKLKTLTQTSYDEIVRITKESYGIQLENEKLTGEHRTNLQRSMFLDLQNLAEDNRRKQFQIQDSQLSEQIRLLERNLERQKQLIGDSLDSFRQFYSDLESDSLKFSNLDLLEKALFGGNTFANAKSKTIGNLQRDVSLIENQIARKNKELNGILSLDSSGNENAKFYQSIQVQALNKEILGLNETLEKNKKNLAEWQTYIQADFLKIGGLIDLLRQGNININTFDDIRIASLEKIHLLQTEQIDNEIKAIQERTKLAKGAEIEQFVFERNGLISKKNLLIYQQGTEAAKLYSETIKGINEEIEKLINKDPKTIGILKDFFNHQQASGTLGLLRDIELIQMNLASGDVNATLKIELAYLKDILDLRNKELDAVISINRSQLELSQSMTISNNEIRASVYEHLARQQTLNQSIASGINQTYDAVINKVNSSLDKLNEKTKGFLSFLIEPVKAIQADFVTGIFSNIVDSIFPPELSAQFKKTGNPIVNAITESNAYLKTIADAVKPKVAPSVSGGSGLGNLGSLLNIAFGGGSSSGGGNLGNRIGIGSGSIFNFGGVSTDSILTPDATTGGAEQILNFGRSPISKIFGAGGIFGKEGFGNNPGTFGAIGSGVSLIGSLFGNGRVGSTISGIGQGLSIGASIGSIVPGIGTAIGAGIGALVGGIIGLFTGGKQKKEEQKTAKSALDETVNQLTKIRDEMAAAKQGIDINGLISQAENAQSEYYRGISSLKTKSVRNDYTAQGRTRIDPLVSEIKTLSAKALILEEIRAAAAERNNRILPEFASGVYVKRNGMTGGTFTGRDNLPALLAQGEMVLNPNQISRVKQNAGFDVFANAGIPNYSPEKIPSFANGVNLPSVSFTPSSTGEPIYINVSIDAEVDAEGITLKGIEGSSNVKRGIVTTMEKAVENRQFKPKKS